MSGFLRPFVVGCVLGSASCMEYAEIPRKSSVKSNASSCRALPDLADHRWPRASASSSGRATQRLTSPSPANVARERHSEFCRAKSRCPRFWSRSLWSNLPNGIEAPRERHTPSPAGRCTKHVHPCFMGNTAGRPSFKCICKICGRSYTSKCADSRVCPDCRSGTRKRSIALTPAHARDDR
jgi:hypothetical protein